MSDFLTAMLVIAVIGILIILSLIQAIEIRGTPQHYLLRDACKRLAEIRDQDREARDDGDEWKRDIPTLPPAPHYHDEDDVA